MEERLQKILAKAGLASRRAAEAMIAAGRVAVDGQVVSSLGSKADLARQNVTLDGQPIGRRPDFHYWIAHKPPGLLSTRSDPQGRRTVMSLLPAARLREMLYPVGRLDLDSEGLMLLTNDGELAYRLMHPRFKVPKFYKAWVAGQPEEAGLERLRQGIVIEGKKTAPAEVELLRAGIYRSQLSFILVEGRKREIRLMCQAIGHPVIQLVRLKLGSISLGSLEKGKARTLTMAEVRALKNLVGLEEKPAQRRRAIGADKPRGNGERAQRHAQSGGQEAREKDQRTRPWSKREDKTGAYADKPRGNGERAQRHAQNGGQEAREKDQRTRSRNKREDKTGAYADKPRGNGERAQRPGTRPGAPSPRPGSGRNRRGNNKP